jgi:transposase InsO family protein
LASDFPITRLCAQLKVTPGGYYAWLHRSPSLRERYNEKLVKTMQTIHQQVKATYGSLRMTVELNRRGYTCSENKIAVLMQHHGLKAKMDRRFKGRPWFDCSYIKKPNLLAEQGQPTRCHAVWVADFTYTRIKGQFVYLSTIMDLYSRKIVGYHISKTRTAALVKTTLAKAIKATGGKCPDIFHSDRGIEYANYTILDYLAKRGIKQSMSGKAYCYDNAHAESFFHTFKSEFYKHEHFNSIKEFKMKTSRYLQFYNKRRLHSSLGYQSPLHFELQAA